jgi:uncharacterized Tic20 family protein
MDEVTSTERTWAAAGHWAALLGIIPLPFSNIVGPLVVFGVERTESEFAAYHAKQSFYLQGALEVLMLALLVTSLIGFGLISKILGWPTLLERVLTVVIILWYLLRLAALAFAGVAGVKVYQGGEFRYPFFGDFATKY